MPWSTAANRIPHVFENIFAHLEGRDGLAAAEACPTWESAIFGSQTMRKHLALKIFHDPQDSRYFSFVDILAYLGISISSDQQMITVEDVSSSCRRYDSIIMSPGPEHDVVWEDLIGVLKNLNRRLPIRWAKIDGSNGDAHQLTKPSALMEIGRIFKNLQHLELVLTKKSLWEPDWPRVFECFPRLESLILHHGHVMALDSVRRNCPHLKRVELFDFSLPCPRSATVFVPQVHKLIVDGAVIIDRHQEDDRDQRVK